MVLCIPQYIVFATSKVSKWALHNCGNVRSISHLPIHEHSKRIRDIIDFTDFDALASKPDASKLIEVIVSFAIVDAQNAK